MRLFVGAVVATLSTAAITGCGSEPTASPHDPSRVKAYTVLAKETARFFAAAQVVERTRPDADPRTVEELLALVDYSFGDGVALTVFDPGAEHVCFTGPEETYLSLSEHGDALRRILGTGDCAYEDGEVVLEVTLDEGAGPHLAERVLKGEDIAEQIPALDDFIDILGQDLAATGRPEG